jgi:hypothetical protein
MCKHHVDLLVTPHVKFGPIRISRYNISNIITNLGLLNRALGFFFKKLYNVKDDKLVGVASNSVC